MTALIVPAGSGPVERKLEASESTLDVGGVRGLLRRVVRRCATRSEVIDWLTRCSIEPLNPELIFEFVHELRHLTPPQTLEGSESAVNIVGTGQGVATFNISTAAAIVASAAGACVLKSGSSAQSSRCGSLDVLRALGIARVQDRGSLTRMLADVRLAFVPESHYSFVLRALALLVQPQTFRDIGRFVNTVGPLLAPYRVGAQLTGVSRSADFDRLVNAAVRLEYPKMLFVHAEPGLDEFCSFAQNRCQWASPGARSFEIDAREFGFGHGNLTELAGGDPAANAGKIREILAGNGARAATETVAMNAGGLLWVSGQVSSLGMGIERAARAIRDRLAERHLERVVSSSAAPSEG